MKPLVRRPVLALLPVAAVALASLAVAPTAVSGSPDHVARRAPAPAGLAGTPIVLTTQSSIHGYDIAVGPDGTAYVGWIAGVQGGARTVFACVLPLGATQCLNGGQSTSALDVASAKDIQVIAPVGSGNALLLWFHDTADSISGPFGGRIAMSTLTPGAVLSGGNDVLPVAPSFGSLLTAERGPGDQVWMIYQEAPGNGDEITVVSGIAGLSTPLDPPWLVNKARLGFDDGDAVVVVDRAGAVSEQLRVISQADGWSSFTKVSGTWNVGGAFDVATRIGSVKLVAPINNADYYPRISTWGGTQFGTFSLTGHKTPCPKYSHDLHPDPSGRLADAYFDCNKVVVANHPKAKTAAFASFNVGGTPAGGDPQIGTIARGLGWVAWGRQEADAITGNRLLVAPIRLPAQKTTKSKSATSGKVTVTGPVSCLPAVQTTIGVSAKPASGWSVINKTLKLDGAVHGTGLNGSELDPGSNHTVSGTVKFKKGGQTKTVTAQLSFAACVTL